MKTKIISVFLVLLLGVFCLVSTSYAKKASVDTEKKADCYKVAVINTNKGILKAVLFTDKAPITSNNFIELAESGFYKGMKFHRVVEDFVIQTGDPTGFGDGGSDKTIPLEINKRLRHKKAGVLSMARKADPDSATSQFFITLSRQSGLDGKYAVFGFVVEGLDAIHDIVKGDKLKSIEIIDVPKKELKVKY